MRAAFNIYRRTKLSPHDRTRFLVISITVMREGSEYVEHDSRTMYFSLSVQEKIRQQQVKCVDGFLFYFQKTENED